MPGAQWQEVPRVRLLHMTRAKQCVNTSAQVGSAPQSDTQGLHSTAICSPLQDLAGTGGAQWPAAPSIAQLLCDRGLHVEVGTVVGWQVGPGQPSMVPSNAAGLLSCAAR